MEVEDASASEAEISSPSPLAKLLAVSLFSLDAGSDAGLGASGFFSIRRAILQERNSKETSPHPFRVLILEI